MPVRVPHGEGEAIPRREAAAPQAQQWGSGLQAHPCCSKLFAQAVKQELHHKNNKCTNISAWVKGAQLKKFKFGTLLLLIFSLFPLGDQLPEANGCSTDLSGLMKCKHSFIYFLTLGSKHLQLYK